MIQFQSFDAFVCTLFENPDEKTRPDQNAIWSRFVSFKLWKDYVRDGAVEEEVEDMQEVRVSDSCMGDEITYFRCELWWIFVRSPLSLAVNLHNFTAFTAFHGKIMYEICGEKTNFSPLILHFFAFFSRPGTSQFKKSWHKYYKIIA